MTDSDIMKPESSLSLHSSVSNFSLQSSISNFSIHSSPNNLDVASTRSHCFLRAFTFSELKAATKNFSTSLKIGEGGFGSVHRGVVRDVDSNKKVEIAVKKLCRSGLQGHKEWITEVNVLGVVEHPNLVKLLGYCIEDTERGTQRLLVYEYLPNRSVHDHLSNRFQTVLSWEMRVKIAHDAARGLTYLHEGMDFQIIFRDFKSSNILLDDHWNARLSDFGMARLGPPDGQSHVSTTVIGTIAYASPEYLRTGHLTPKNDVWAYGVFLYELITGRTPLDLNRPKGEQKLLEWVKPHLSNQMKFKLILDPKLDADTILRSAQKLATVANRCLVARAKERPMMSEVLDMVDRISRTVEAPDRLFNRGTLCSNITDDSESRCIVRIWKFIHGKIQLGWSVCRNKLLNMQTEMKMKNLSHLSYGNNLDKAMMIYHT